MRRRPKFWASLILLTVLGGGAVTLARLLQVEPDFYVDAWHSPKDGDDSALASEVLTRLDALQNDLRDSAKVSWEWSYSAEELNAFFRDGQTGSNPLITNLFGKLPEPRFAIRGDHLLIAFRHGEGRWSTVITLELRCWLVKDQPNKIAVEFIGFRAGAVPLPKYLLLERFSEMAHKQNTDVNWYSHDGRPVALCQLYANQPRSESQISTLKIEDGRLTVGGRHLISRAGGEIGQ